MALTKIQAQNIENGAITQELLDATVASSLGDIRVTNVAIANSSYTILDDTAVNVGGGYIVITGADFQSGAQVVIDTTNATSTTFVNTTTLRAEVPAKSAATYNLYVVNPDGAVGIKLNGLTYSGFPTWVTSSTLANVRSNQAFTGSLSATGATSYANTTALPAGFNLVTANGYYYGNISVGSDTTYSFTVKASDAENQDSDRTFNLFTTTKNPPNTVQYLVVAGGGGGSGGRSGIHEGGGGGAGGMLTGNLSVTEATQYTITVGSGGSGGAGFSLVGSQGSNSVFHTVTSNGGGFGSGITTSAGNGGSGGGSWNPGLQGSGIPGQGNNGGGGNASYAAGGGGGAGSAGLGGDGQTGGDGLSSSITGSSLFYAGGGGGARGGYTGSGGSGVGGNGSDQSNDGNGTNGTTNRGGGGGGGQSNNRAGGNGGSGVVVLRYADTFDFASNTTGSPTVTTSGGFRIYQFTGSGSITL